MKRMRRVAQQHTFANHVAQGETNDLDALLKEALPFAAATAVIESPDRGFWLSEVLDEVMTVRSMKEFTKAMFGRQDAHFQKMATEYLMERLRRQAKIRDSRTNVRVYVSWRIPGYRPRRWGALHYVGPEQLRLVARDYGILGEGIEYSRDATLYLVDLMEKMGAVRVEQVWEQAAEHLEDWRKSRAS